MKKKILSFLLLVSVALSSVFGLIACGDTGDTITEKVDYVSQVTFDLNSTTAKEEVKVKSYIDGDTTHFYLPDSFPEDVSKSGILKARYIAVNTPESTGIIEEWGKKASNFTKQKLSNATSIYIESDKSTWETDSTNERYLVWVWYMPKGETTYRNLNIELLQEGLAIGSKAGDTRYGSTCTKVINQAIQLKLHVHSNEVDPDYFYADAIPVTLRELRTNLEYYIGKRVAFEGIVTTPSAQSVYVENYDEETNQVYGMYVYYGYNFNPFGMELLAKGNHVRIVGNVTHDNGFPPQISNLSYDPRDTENPEHIKLLDNEKHDGIYRETTVDEFFSDVTVTIDTEDGTVTKTKKYCDLAMNTTISMKGLKVIDTYTTKQGDNEGAITLTCQANGKTITVRTVVLRDANNDLILESVFAGKTINVVGIIDSYNEEAQVKAFSFDSFQIY